MKKYIALFLILCIMIVSVTACGNTPVETTESTTETTAVVSEISATDNYPFVAQLLRNESGEITGVAVKQWNGDASEVTIPSEYVYEDKTYPVTMVGYYLTLVSGSPLSVTSVSIPSSVKTVSTRAFTNFIALKKATLSEGLTSIEDMAFWKCIALEEIVLPSTLVSIGANAFSDCRTLKTLTIPANVTTIGTGAFAGCTGLTDVTISSAFKDRVTDIFANCPNITYHFN